jgi:hypothetical protein
MPFVESLIILGISQVDIIFKHILPNIIEIISARYILTVAYCMLTEASVSFLGLGDPVQVTWGGMVNSAFRSVGFIRGFFNPILGTLQISGSDATLFPISYKSIFSSSACLFRDDFCLHSEQVPNNTK